jgi:single-strand DNA-binding protein
MGLPRINGEFGVYKDPELRFSQSGKAVIKIACIAKKRVRDSNGEWTDGDPCFLDVTAFGKIAENAAESIVKGATITVDGVLEQQHWDDKETGEKRSKYAVVADSVSMSLKWNGYDTRDDDRASSNTASAAAALGGTEVQTDEPPF